MGRRRTYPQEKGALARTWLVVVSLIWGRRGACGFALLFLSFDKRVFFNCDIEDFGMM